MRARCTIVLCFAAIAGFSAGLAVAQSDLDALQKQVHQLADAGKYDEALNRQRALARKIEEAEKRSTGRAGPKTAGALGSLAWHALLGRKLDEALAAAERSRTIAPELIWVELNRAHALLFLGRLKEARATYLAHKGQRIPQNDDKLWEEVVAEDFEILRKAGLGPAAMGEIAAALELDKALELAALTNEISRLSEKGMYSKAIPLVEKYIALARQHFGEKHIEFAAGIALLGVLFEAEGRYAEAEPLLRRALAIRENALGPDHADVGTNLDMLADILQRTNRLVEAEPLVRRALLIKEKAFGSDDPELTTTLNHLAELLEATNRSAEAEPLLKRSLVILEKALAPEHPDIVTSLNKLAGLYNDQGRYAEAEPLFQRSLAIREKALGPDHADVATSLNNLAVVYASQGRNGEAEPLDKRALAIREKALGPDHPDVAASLNNLGVLYKDQGRYADAEPLYKRALAIREKAQGPDAPDVAPGWALSGPGPLCRGGAAAKAQPCHPREGAWA
jgi:tetratricopeptide (TPR) repeat protein